jgi:WD40 repeat protein
MDKKEMIKYIVKFLNEKSFSDISNKLEKESGVLLESEEIKVIKNLLNEVSPENQNEKLSEILSIIDKTPNISKFFKEELNSKVELFHIFKLISNMSAKDIDKDNLRSDVITKIRTNIIKSNNEEVKNIFKKCVGLLFIQDKLQLKEKMKEISTPSSSLSELIKFIENFNLQEQTNLDICNGKVRTIKGENPKLANRNLTSIIDYVLKNQIKFCKYHNQGDTRQSYFFDHECKSTAVPNKVMFTIDNKEEVLNIVLSNNNRYFAAILKEKDIIIYKITQNKARKQSNAEADSLILNQISPLLKESQTPLNNKYIDINLINTLKEVHKKPINSLMWNSKDSLILTASKDKTVKLTDPFTGITKLTLDGHNEQVSSAIFVENETKILSSGLDYKISLWKMDSRLEHSVSIPSITISELLYSQIMNFVIIVAATTNSILIYDINTKIELDKIPMNDAIISVAISKLDKGLYLLINSSTATPVLNLLNLKTKKFIRKYFGHRQERFINKCNFGGRDERFLVCGSEDANIYIWNRQHSVPIHQIKAHSSPVNSVVWPCIFPDIIISCSDDHTVNILSNDSLDKVYYSNVRLLEHKTYSEEGKLVEFPQQGQHPLNFSTFIERLNPFLERMLGSNEENEEDDP